MHSEIPPLPPPAATSACQYRSVPAHRPRKAAHHPHPILRHTPPVPCAPPLLLTPPATAHLQAPPQLPPSANWLRYRVQMKYGPTSVATRRRKTSTGDGSSG